MTYLQFATNLEGVGATASEALRVNESARRRAFGRFSMPDYSAVYTEETMERLWSEERARIWEAIRRFYALGEPWKHIRDLIE